MVKPFHGKITNGLTYCSFVICTFLVSGVAYFAFYFRFVLCVRFYMPFVCLPRAIYFVFFSFFFFQLFVLFLYLYLFLQFPFLDLFVCVFVCLFLSLNALTLFLVIIFRLVSSFIDVAFVKSFKFPFFTGLVFRILVPTFFKRLFQRVSYLSASKAQRNAIDKLVCPQQNKI